MHFASIPGEIQTALRLTVMVNSPYNRIKSQEIRNGWWMSIS